MRTINILLAAVAVGAALIPLEASAATYAVEKSGQGVVDMYDLSSVSQTPNGFSITDVVTAKHWPNVFGPISYRVARETYNCASGTYDITAITDYRADRAPLVRLKSRPVGAMRMVPDTASSGMYDRFCPAAQRRDVAGLSPAKYVEEKTAFSAHQYGRGLLIQDQAGQ